MTGRYSFFLSLLYLALFPLDLFAWTLASDSLLLQNKHPRLWFIPESYRVSKPEAPGITVTEMRSKLTNYQSSNFQALIDEMDSRYSEAVSSKTKLYLTNDAINYAFLYMVDPSNMPGFNSIHTKSEYAAKAKECWVRLANNVKNETGTSANLSAWLDTRYVYATDTTRGGPINLALALVYDWLDKAYFDSSDITLLLDAMDNAYAQNTNQLAKKTPYLSNGASGMLHNAYYVALALHGDTVDAELDARFDEIEGQILRGIRDLSNLVFNQESNWSEGIEIYAFESFVHVSLLFGGIGSAMGEDLFYTTKVLQRFPEFAFYNKVPYPVGGIYNWMHFDDDSPHGAMDDVPTKRAFYLLTGMLNKSNPHGAGLLKWFQQDSGWPAVEYKLNKPRIDYVMFRFFGGMSHVVSKTPQSVNLPLSTTSGEEVIMKSDLTDDNSTHIVFWTPRYLVLPGGHSHYDSAAFLIHKYGNLAIQRSINKSYSGGNLTASKYNMFYNTIGVYRPGEVNQNRYNLMSYRDKGYDEGALYPENSSYQSGGANNIGNTEVSDLEGVNYDYIDYNYTRSWDSGKVDYAEREFVYLRSAAGTNDEYSIVFDRINSIDSSNTKYYLLHSSYEPRLLGNSNNEITLTKENYPNDPDSTGGRWVHTSASPTSDNTIEIITNYSNNHGKLYNKTLLPDAFQINKIGGPNHLWEDADGKLIHTKTLTSKEEYYRGRYTMQIQSKTNKNFDTFLNVMQIGDSKTLASMTPVEKITASGSNGTMVGALIKDSTVNRVVLFNPARPSSVGKVKPTLTYVITTTAPSFHLLTNLFPNTLYSIRRNGAELTTFQSSGGGVVRFEDPSFGAGISYSIELAGGAWEEYPSEPGRRLEIQAFTSPEKVRLRWYQSKDDDLAGNIVYKIYFDSDASFPSPGTILSPSISTEETYSGRIYTAYFTPVGGSQYYYKVASVYVSSGRESSLDFSYPVTASFSTPSVSSFSISDLSSGNSSLSDSSTIAVSANGTDPQGSGTIAKWRITESPSMPSVSVMNNGSASSPSSYTISGQERLITLYLWIMDQDGNISLLSNSSTAQITLGIPPTGATDFKVR